VGGERGGREGGRSRYKLPATGPQLYCTCSSNELYKHCFTNAKDSVDVELENLFSLLHNLKIVTNIWQVILNECKLAAENLGVLAEFTTIRERKRKYYTLTITEGSLK
jgi:hypothetical protein